MAKQVLLFLGLKMANFCQQVLKPLGSFTRVFTVTETVRSVLFSFSQEEAVVPRLMDTICNQLGIWKEMKCVLTVARQVSWVTCCRSLY